MNGSMNEWNNESMNESMNERTNARIDKIKLKTRTTTKLVPYM